MLIKPKTKKYFCLKPFSIYKNSKKIDKPFTCCALIITTFKIIFRR